MKKIFAVLAATFAMMGSAVAGQAIMITNNGIVIYDDSKVSRDWKIYNSAAPLPKGYKRVCNDRYSRYDYRNKNCVTPPKRFGPPHMNGHRPPPPPHPHMNGHKPHPKPPIHMNGHRPPPPPPHMNGHRPPPPR